MEPVPPLPAAKEDVSRDVQATCDALAVRVKQERRNMLILSLGVVILTPFLILAGVAGVLIGGAIVCSRSGFDLIKAVGALGIVTMFLTVMWVAGLVCQIEAMNRKKAHWRSAAASAACFAAAVALAHWTTLPDTLPALFWPLYIVLGICVIGIAGRAYDPTIQLTMDGAQIGRTEALGCVLVVCSALVEAYGSILGGSCCTPRLGGTRRYRRSWRRRWASGRPCACCGRWPSCGSSCRVRMRCS
jgi:hypothetical protein